jgi:hypothetical protein
LLCSGYLNDKLFIGVIPSQREGIHFLGDWNNMGQRQTDSGTTHFEQVRIFKDELLLNPGPLSTPYASLRPLIAQLIFVHLFWVWQKGHLKRPDKPFSHKKHGLNQVLKLQSKTLIFKSILPNFMFSLKVFVY